MFEEGNTEGRDIVVQKQEEQVLEENIKATGEQDTAANPEEAKEQECCPEGECQCEGECKCTDETAEEETASHKEKKKKEKKEKKDKKDEKIEELTDRVTRQMAEFDNFRKRTEKEKAQMFDLGAKNVIEKILPVIDNFERGFTTVEEGDKEDAFVQGMSQVYKQLMTELEAIGVKPIEAVGQEFNPDFHNAVMQVESQEYESGVVAQELMKGYMYKDSVVRHSMVAVVG